VTNVTAETPPDLHHAIAMILSATSQPINRLLAGRSVWGHVQILSQIMSLDGFLIFTSQLLLSLHHDLIYLHPQLHVLPFPQASIVSTSCSSTCLLLIPRPAARTCSCEIGPHACGGSPPFGRVVNALPYTTRQCYQSSTISKRTNILFGEIEALVSAPASAAAGHHSRCNILSTL
jgi:hypothetical protein